MGFSNPWFQSVQQVNKQLVGPTISSRQLTITPSSSNTVTIINGLSYNTANNVIGTTYQNGKPVNVTMLACQTCNAIPCICVRCANCNNPQQNCVCLPSTTALATGPQFYNPSMLSRGNNNEQLARQKAIDFRNLMLGNKAKDLYSPNGLQIQSKKWPGRIYVAYAHHMSLQVYDYGVNIGRLDVHTDGYNVPAGDTHLAAILKVMHDEENMIKQSSFSRVRDI